MHFMKNETCILSIVYPFVSIILFLTFTFLENKSNWFIFITITFDKK